MGLDMYLRKKTYVGAKWEHRKVKGKISLTQDGKPIEVKLNRVAEIVEEAGYWRKANAIHKWFVNNVQEGEDDCKEYYVSKEQLQELLGLVNKVLDNSVLIEGKIKNGIRYENGKEEPIIEDGKFIKDPTIAKELLPTEPGFFFGGQEYDQYYYSDLEDTKKMLEEVLKEDGDFYYQASW